MLAYYEKGERPIPRVVALATKAFKLAESGGLSEGEAHRHAGARFDGLRCALSYAGNASNPPQSRRKPGPIFQLRRYRPGGSRLPPGMRFFFDPPPFSDGIAVITHTAAMTG
jgi:hypothetical protein